MNIQYVLVRAVKPLRRVIARLDSLNTNNHDNVTLFSYVEFAKATLFKFHSEVLNLYQSPDISNSPILSTLVEKTVKAVSLVESKERELIINTLLCA
jgi:hypothetical protein